MPASQYALVCFSDRLGVVGQQDWCFLSLYSIGKVRKIGLDLMLTFVENGTRFSDKYGDIDEPFYESLELMLDDFRNLLLDNPNLYETGDFSLRLPRLLNMASWMGWGYGDYVTEQVSKIMQHFGDV